MDTFSFTTYLKKKIWKACCFLKRNSAYINNFNNFKHKLSQAIKNEYKWTTYDSNKEVYAPTLHSWGEEDAEFISCQLEALNFIIPS